MCKEEVSTDHEEEPEEPEGEEDLHDRTGDAYDILITNVCSYAPSGKNFITTDVKTLMFWSVDFHSMRPGGDSHIIVITQLCDDNMRLSITGNIITMKPCSLANVTFGVQQTLSTLFKDVGQMHRFTLGCKLKIAKLQAHHTSHCYAESL